MKVVAFKQARDHLDEMMDAVCDDHAPIIITGKNGRTVVMISTEDYEAMDETEFLLRSPKNARRLRESLAELKAGRGTVRELIE